MNELSKRGHIPVRTCLACMCKKPKSELVRLGMDRESGRIVMDGWAKMEGRGGYACRECLPGLRFDRRVQRAFRNRARGLCVAQELPLEK